MGYLTTAVLWEFKWFTPSNLCLFVVIQSGAGLAETWGSYLGCDT